MLFPQDLFLLRDFHQFILAFPMAIAEGSSLVWALMPAAAAAMRRAGRCAGTRAASCGQLNTAVLRFPQGKVGPFLPSLLGVLISCFHFQCFGILGWIREY